MPLSHRVRFGYIENVYIILLFAKEGRLHEATCLSNFATPAIRRQFLRHIVRNYGHVNSFYW